MRRRMFHALITVPLGLLLLLALFGQYKAYSLEQRFPPAGTFQNVDGTRLHMIDTGSKGLPPGAPTILFIHGASGNLLDARNIFEPQLKGRARLIFVDRPGHGYSERGDAVGPGPQARLFGELLSRLNIDRAIVVGHSYGGAVAAAVPLEAPDKVSGLVLISAPTHLWPTGIDWYHHLVTTPVLGPLFVRTILPAFISTVDAIGHGMKSVFRPHPVPEMYREKTAVELLMRPNHFTHNSQDIAALYDHNADASKRYGKIRVPTAIIAGEDDTIVSTDLHARTIVKQIEASRLTVLPDTGHKPDYTHTGTVISEIERVAREAGTPLAGSIDRQEPSSTSG